MMSNCAAIVLSAGAYSLGSDMLRDAILEIINAQHSPAEQLSWAEYEMMIAEERLWSAAARQQERESQVKAEQKSFVLVKATEATIIAKMQELSRCRWHAPVRQSQGDPDVTRMAESMPVPPTFMNHMGLEAA